MAARAPPLPKAPAAGAAWCTACRGVPGRQFVALAVAACSSCGRPPRLVLSGAPPSEAPVAARAPPLLEAPAAGAAGCTALRGMPGRQIAGVSAHRSDAGTVRLAQRRWAVSPEDSVTVQWPGCSLDCPRTMPRRPLMGLWTWPWTTTTVPAWSRGGIQAAKRPLTARR